MKKKKKNLSISRQNAAAGWLFSIPFIIGFIFFFLAPVIRGIILSFQTRVGEGSVMEFSGLVNYHRLFFVDPYYIRDLFSSLQTMVITSPSILLFSFFIATLLNQRFRGRIAARAIFFLPIVISSGVIAMLTNSHLQQVTVSQISSQASDVERGVAQLTGVVMNMLSEIRLDPWVFNFVTNTVSRVYDITISSGIQILIFLAGLQTIPPALYEASSIEGATGWENFWKITFPMVSPLILVNAIYTIIDSMSGTTNHLMNTIYQRAFAQSDFGYSAAMSWVYFGIIAIVLSIFIALCNRFVYYEN